MASAMANLDASARTASAFNFPALDVMPLRLWCGNRNFAHSLMRGPRLVECARMKLKRLADVIHEVIKAVVAGIKVELVPDVFGR